MKKVDYLIIGQGIAGTLLAHFLLKKGKSVRIVDRLYPNSSSRVAAGIFNPITGRRFVKTWKADEIFPFAEKTYSEIEKETNSRFFFPKTIVRVLSQEAEIKEWEKKSRNPEYADYLKQSSSKSGKKVVEIKKGGHVDLVAFLTAMREKFKKEAILFEEELDFNDLTISTETVKWKTTEVGKLIFCEGIKAMNNPWFGHLPFTHAKGEVLTISSKQLDAAHILSKGIFVLPVGESLFKVGSTYDWDDLSESTTENGRMELTEKLEKLIDCNYSVADHQAGIRPTVKDRRPMIGLHPDFPNLGIFNGLGTKGVSLGPFFANHFVEFLEDGEALIPEVDISRFS